MNHRLKLLVWAVLASFAFTVSASATGADLADAMTQFKAHLDGTTPLTAAQIQSLADTVTANQNLVGNTSDLMTQAKLLIQQYEISNSLFRTSPTYNGFTRDDFSTVGYAQAQFMIRLMQAFINDACNAANLATYPSIFDGFNFQTAKYFPGNCNPPADPNAIYSVQINASQPLAWGYEVLYQTDPARRPTGAYLAPGSIATVTVPPALVNQGFTILVGAHTYDKGSGNYLKDKYERMDQVAVRYSITSTNTAIANPLGGGIYIEVPYGKVMGLVTIQFKNTVRSPFFSKTVARQTTLAEWVNTERSYPGPWADFESDKCMFNTPRDWIYNFADPVTMMKNWDMAMDAISDLQGLPLIRPKTILYGQVDTSFKTGAGSPGYPQENDNWNPHVLKGGDNPGHHYLYGPKFADSLHLHELGHGISISKFAGETESLVNFIYVAVHNRKFGVDLDEVFGRSVGNAGCATVTRDQAALMWVLDPDFRAGLDMDNGSMKYQQRGYGKYAEIAALFGWKALGSFWKSEAIDAENGILYDTNPTQYLTPAQDDRILRMSRAVGVDLTPLIHFWGVHPGNPTTLKSNITAAGLLPSPLIYERLVHYRDIVPHNQTAFNTHYFAVSAAPRDTDWYTAQKASYDLTVGTEAVAKIQQLIDLYFPTGRPAELPRTNTTIYTETFDGAGGPLEGKTTTTGGGTWIANPLANDAGILTSNAGSAMLRFDPIPNQIYTVSLDFNYSSGIGGWLGLGFSDHPPTSTDNPNAQDRFTGTTVPGYAWMIVNTTNASGVWAGPKTANAISYTTGVYGTAKTLKIVLDTAGDGSSFTADFLVNGASITGGPRTINVAVETLNYVGFTQYGSSLLAGSTIDNFSLVNNTNSVPVVITNSWADVTDTFSGATGVALNGRTTTTGGKTWIANSIVTNNGTGSGIVTASAGSAVIPFDPTTNQTYTLSVDLNVAGTGTGSWLGLGFSSSSPASPGISATSDRFSNVNVPGYAWMLCNDQNGVTMYKGPQAGAANVIGTASGLSNGLHTLSIKLDTTGNGSSFTAQFFVDGVSRLGPTNITATTVAGINYAGITAYGSATLVGSTVDNFSLVRNVTTGFAGWINGYGLSGTNAAWNNDFDGDGANNLLEYAQNGNPTNANSQGSSPQMAGYTTVDGVDYLCHVHVERASAGSGLVYTLESASDLTLGDWIPSPDAVFLGEAVNGDYKTVTNGIPISEKSGEFLRMNIQQN